MSQLLSLASKESETESSLEELLLEELLLESRPFLEYVYRIFLIFFISLRATDYLEMLYIILFCFLRAFSSFLHFFRLIIPFHSISPNYHRSYHSILFCLVSMHDRAVLVTMQSILPLSHSHLLGKQAIALVTVLLVRLFLGPLLERRIPVLAFFFLVILQDLSLSDREADLVDAIFLI